MKKKKLHVAIDFEKYLLLSKISSRYNKSLREVIEKAIEELAKSL